MHGIKQEEEMPDSSSQAPKASRKYFHIVLQHHCKEGLVFTAFLMWKVRPEKRGRLPQVKVILKMFWDWHPALVLSSYAL